LEIVDRWVSTGFNDFRFQCPMLAFEHYNWRSSTTRCASMDMLGVLLSQIVARWAAAAGAPRRNVPRWDTVKGVFGYRITIRREFLGSVASSTQ
jgi:hypothetical protein